MLRCPVAHFEGGVLVWARKMLIAYLEGRINEFKPTVSPLEVFSTHDSLGVLPLYITVCPEQAPNNVDDIQIEAWCWDWQ